MYINCHSCFSLRYGTLTVAELVGLAKANGVETLALTDIHNSSACYDFVQACREVGIKPIIGMEFRQGDETLYIALARNINGFREINAFYSQYAMYKKPFPELPPSWSDVYVVYPWSRREHVSLSEHEFLGIRPSQLRQYYRSPYQQRSDKLVALQPLTFADKTGFNLHRLLRAIDHNTLLSKLTPAQQASEEDIFIPPDQLRAAYKDHPWVLANTQRMLDGCVFDFEFGVSRNRQTFTGGKYEDMILLEKLALDGLKKRYGLHHREARKRLERELEIIARLDFNAYFLITWDFINYGRNRGFFHVGRGSGANSITAYCLGITDVDPIELDLYFERFLNPMRSSPPDFDIDYSWKDRDEVIDYVFKRYRHSHTVLLATYNTFKYRSSVRELGKVFGLPKAEIDKLTEKRYPPPDAPDKITRLIFRYAQLMEGFPNHLSIHAGGILISEAPIHTYTATDLPPKGFPITHFDMYVAEEVGLYKFDVLSQRGLGHIQEGVELAYRNKGARIDIHDVARFKEDEKVRELLVSGRTVGCFYIESPAMRMLLRRLKCDNYLTLVAASSIIRPGVARSGMMQRYIERHNGKPFTHIHPKMAELLDDTYGVMVYQEDVIKVAHHFAGLDLAAADMLRRAMSGKYRSSKVFEEIAGSFFANCREREYPEAISQEVWRQIESFAGYSFSKAHSASFAVESYQSLFLKAYFPLEFITAVINNFGGFYRTEIYVHEARMLGARVHPPCVNRSGYLTGIDGKDIFLGFIHLKDIGGDLGKRIPLECRTGGPFRDLSDFLRRVEIGLEPLLVLIRIGAFRFTGKLKKNLLWEARLHFSKPLARNKQKEALFSGKEKEFAIPLLHQNIIEDAYDEMELLGFPLCSPFDLTDTQPEGTICASDLCTKVGELVRICGYLVTTKTVKTIRNELMFFASYLDSAGDFFDVTVFPPQAKAYPLRGAGVYLLQGKVVDDFGVFTLEISYLERLPWKPDPRRVEKGVRLGKAGVA